MKASPGIMEAAYTALKNESRLLKRTSLGLLGLNLLVLLLNTIGVDHAIGGLW